MGFALKFIIFFKNVGMNNLFSFIDNFSSLKFSAFFTVIRGVEWRRKGR
jgi:hypothetical protein